MIQLCCEYLSVRCIQLYVFVMSPTRFRVNPPLFISINWSSLVSLLVEVQKTYSKMHLVSCTDTHHDVKASVNHEMVTNTKTWPSRKRNIIFPWNKKILNLCLRWHLLRSYRFEAEVTLNTMLKNSILCKLGSLAFIWYGI